MPTIHHSCRRSTDEASLALPAQRTIGISSTNVRSWSYERTEHTRRTKRVAFLDTRTPRRCGERPCTRRARLSQRAPLRGRSSLIAPEAALPPSTTPSPSPLPELAASVALAAPLVLPPTPAMHAPFGGAHSAGWAPKIIALRQAARTARGAPYEAPTYSTILPRCFRDVEPVFQAFAGSLERLDPFIVELVGAAPRFVRGLRRAVARAGEIAEACANECSELVRHSRDVF